MSLSRKFVRLYGTAACLCVLSLSLAGCAGYPKDPSADSGKGPLASGAAAAAADEADETGISDPLEPVNRVTFAFNEMLDAILITPLTKIYHTVVPEVARNGVHNVLDNLKSPVYAANELLQGDVKGAGTVVRRFATNTVLGVGGIVDVAAKRGVTYQPEDFGQTLASWGVESGPYIVWPVLGPSSLRDSVGFVADIGMDPIYWYAVNGDHDAINYTRAGATFVDTKDRTLGLMEDLRRNSGDMYTALKSVYVQRRKALQNDLDPNKAALPTIE